MRQFREKVKTGWVYLLGMALMVGFAGLLAVPQQAKRAEANREPQKQEIKADIKVSEPKNEPKQSETKRNEPKANIQDKPATTSVNSPISANSTAQNPVPVTENKAETKKDAAKMTISGLGTYEVPVSPGDKGFDVLKRAANQNNFLVEYKIYSWGVMITTIGGKKAEGTYYWALYYNGSFSMVGASDLEVKNNDIIEWRYESWM